MWAGSRGAAAELVVQSKPAHLARFQPGVRRSFKASSRAGVRAGLSNIRRLKEATICGPIGGYSGGEWVGLYSYHG